MSFPIPATPELINDPDIYAAVYEFVRQYTVPAIPPDNIYRGWQNYFALPPASNEFAIISLISQERRGTTVEDYDAPAPDADGTLGLHELVLCRMQVDCYSDDDNAARQRAQSLETIARSSAGPSFFGQYKIGCNYASNPQAITEIDGSQQYVKRWMVELHLSYTSSIGLTLPGFDNVTVNIENVDVHHPPK